MSLLDEVMLDGVINDAKFNLKLRTLSVNDADLRLNLLPDKFGGDLKGFESPRLPKIKTGQFDYPSSPRSPQKKSRESTTPPPAPRTWGSLGLALGRNDLRRAQALLEDDPMLASVPISADPNHPLEDPLVQAVRKMCCLGIVELLIDNWADVNQVDRIGQTPLISLCRAPKCSLVEMTLQGATFEDHSVVLAGCLLQKGANPWHRDASGTSAQDYAEQMGNTKLAEYIRDWGSCTMICAAWQCTEISLTALPGSMISNICTYLVNDALPVPGQ